MRKSFDGLAALARQALDENPANGALFVFVNRRRTQMKVLYFDRTGYCLWSKRLEQGTFQVDWSDRAKVDLSWTDLQLILEGIDTRSVRHRRRYKPSERVGKPPASGAGMFA
jgi:transposase